MLLAAGFSFLSQLLSMFRNIPALERRKATWDVMHNRNHLSQQHSRRSCRPSSQNSETHSSKARFLCSSHVVTPGRSAPHRTPSAPSFPGNSPALCAPCCDHASSATLYRELGKIRGSGLSAQGRGRPTLHPTRVPPRARLPVAGSNAFSVPEASTGSTRAPPR